MRAEPRIIPLAEAAGVLLPLVRDRAAGRPVAVVGVTGPVAAGKSTLARLLSACVIATDDYFPDYDLVPEPLRDLPESSDLPRLAADLARLRGRQPAEVPVWSFRSHRRESFRIVTPEPVIVCEGLHALHESLHESLDVKVYVEAPPETRRARVRAREESGARGWSPELAERFFDAHAEPVFAARAAAYRAAADVIVVNP